MHSIKTSMSRPLFALPCLACWALQQEASQRMQTSMSGACICIEVHCLPCSAAGLAAQAAAGPPRLQSWCGQLVPLRSLQLTQ